MDALTITKMTRRTEQKENVQTTDIHFETTPERNETTVAETKIIIDASCTIFELQIPTILSKSG